MMLYSRATSPLAPTGLEVGTALTAEMSEVWKIIKPSKGIAKSSERDSNWRVRNYKPATTLLGIVFVINYKIIKGSETKSQDALSSIRYDPTFIERPSRT